MSRHAQGMTFFLNRLHFIYPVRDFVDLVIANDGVRFDFVEEWVQLSHRRSTLKLIASGFSLQDA